MSCVVDILRRAVSSVCVLALVASSLPTQVIAGQLPSNGTVAAGSARIGDAVNGSMAVTQTSNRAVINWNSFSIGAGNSVTFNQPGSTSAVLNRVTGDTTSTIAGKLSANGQVFLVNPNGIAITPTGTVEVGGGFVASSLNIRTSDFMNGNLAFWGEGGAVSNAGSISVGPGGFAALLGGSVSNSGSITVPNGRIGLGAGTRATLDLTGDGFLQIASPAAGSGSSTRMTGAQVREAVRQVVNMPASAQSITGRPGHIVLGSGGARYAASRRVRVADAGTVSNTGTLSAAAGKITLSGKNVTIDKGSISTVNAVGKGGSIVVTATDTITLLSASLDASGATGGGSIKIGGDYQGGGTLVHANTVTIDATSTINANAITSGNGGQVVIWSDGKTVFDGRINARGGSLSGNGGDAEVSSKGRLSYTGLADLRAEHGAFGTLLLDPYNITISNASDSTSAGFTASGNDSVINVTTRINALNYANVEVKTGAGGAQAGNITLTTPLMWSTRATLTLTAANNIYLFAPITAPYGRLALNAGGTITATGDVLVDTFVLTAGAWVQKQAVLPRFQATDFRLNGGSYLRATGGSGSKADPYTLVDVYGLQRMNTYLSSYFALDADIDARGTKFWNANWKAAGASTMSTGGFTPIGDFFNTAFTGGLDGRGHLISGLTISRNDTSFIGLFGYTNGATLQNFGLENVNVTASGGQIVGAAVGRMDFGTLFNVYSTGVVRGSVAVGGLVGANNGAISNSYSSAAVETRGIGSTMGGLVGANNGSIVNAYALGSVSGFTDVGGLVGLNRGSISSTYASGRVEGNGSAAGGLVGHQSGNGSITKSVSDLDSTRQSNFIGIDETNNSTNLVGVTALGRYANVPYTTAGFDFTTVWTMRNGETRPMLRSEYSTVIRNAHQLQLMGLDAYAKYTLGADIDASATSGSNESDIWSTRGFAPGALFGGFDGQMHVIKNLTINRPLEDNVGLFSGLGEDASVKNVGLVDAKITGRDMVGAFVGSSNGILNNVYVTGSVSGRNMVGGLIGAMSAGLLYASYSSAEVTGTGVRVGGLVGDMRGATISNSYWLGKVKGLNFVGGLVGNAVGQIENSYSSGAVSSVGPMVGGIAGASGATITNTYWDKDSTGAALAVGNLPANGQPGIAIDASNRYLRATYAGFDFNGVWYMVDGAMRPILRSEYSTSIHNAHQLQLMALNLTADYTLANTIDARATAGSNASDIWSTAGFSPIGMGSQFNGSLRGQGYSIDDLTINLPGRDFVGLFSAAATNAWISVDLNRANVTGRQNVGAIAGSNGGTVILSSVTGGQVRGTDNVGGLVGLNSGLVSASSTRNAVSGNANVGGLVGASLGSIFGSQSASSVSGSSNVGGLLGQNAGWVLASFATGDVQGEAGVGGLVGSNRASISLAYATGNVSKLAGSGATANGFGGLVGFNGGTIFDAYAWGAVTGERAVGGLIGQQSGGYTSNTYATGKVTGTANVGGLVGELVAGSLVNSVWDMQSTGQQAAAGSQTGTVSNVAGFTTSQMQDLNTFAAVYKGFDFAKVWWPPSQSSQNGSSQSFYPLLYALSNVLTYKPDDVTTTYGDPRPNVNVKAYGGIIPPGSKDPDFFFDRSSNPQSASGNDNAGIYRLVVVGTCSTCDGTPYVQGDDGKYYFFLALPGTYTVKPREVVVTARGGTSVEGQSSANPGLQLGPVVAGDDPNLVFGRLTNSFGINAGSKAGSYVLTVVGESGDPNYVIVRFDGAWLVTPAPLVEVVVPVPPSGPTASANTPASTMPVSATSPPACDPQQLAKRLRDQGSAPLIDPDRRECTQN